MNNTETNRYSASYVGHDVGTEHARLRTLEVAFDPSTITVLRGLGLPPASICLELGAGAGSIAVWLADHCATGHVTATDIDIRFLTAWASPRLRILTHDVVHEDFPAASFDLVHARALLMHLPDRDRVLARAAGWVRPGGWLVIEDLSVHPVDSSRHPVLKKLTLAGAELLKTSVGSDLRWASGLPGQLRALGLHDVQVATTPGTIGDGSATDAFWRATFDQAIPSLIDGGFADPQDIAEMRTLQQTPGFTDTAIAMISAWGRKPQ